jgi:hypothetical protein
MTKRNVEADISPGLRAQIVQAARKIRGDHKVELADDLKADRAGRLFTSIIRKNGKPARSLKETSSGLDEGVGSLAGVFGGVLSEAIRAGAGLLEGPLTVLTQAWMTTVIGPAAEPNTGMPSAAASVPGETSLPQPSAARQMPSTTVDTVVPGGQASEMPTASTEEVMLRGVLRQFMPMLVSSLNQGGDGHGLAETVITLFGRPTYNQAFGLGKDKIMQLVKTEPDLWAQVAPIETKFSRFLDEFTGYDAWIEERTRQANKPQENSPRGRNKPVTESE